MHPPQSSITLDRRSFVKAISAAGVGLALASSTASVLGQSAVRRKRYAIVGCGSRHRMYQNAIENDYRGYAELVALCDINPGRIEVARKLSITNGAPVPRGYVHTDFEKMIQETKPDIVIVVTVDATHATYIVRALRAGCDVITEKPMTTTAGMCQQILDAQKHTGKRVRVTFNYRYSPPRTQVKEILMSGEIGEVRSVDFQWLLNTSHGADYFRRWHGEKKNSGGLIVHKATHHFDLVNWWLGANPVHVAATGKREFYTPEMARRFGLESHHERCRTCPEQDQCGFFISLEDKRVLKELYLDNESYDGYFRDRCVFNPRIDIEDTMSVLVRYDNNVTLNYSLNAFNAWEGYQIAFNGTLGRLEHSMVEQVYVNGTNTVQGAIADNGVTTRVIPLRGAPRLIEPWTGDGAHGGGDKAMLDDIFLADPPADKYLRDSDERGGANSILIGVAANECFKTGLPVDVRKLVTGLTPPPTAPMPSRTGRLLMPRRNPV